MAVRSSATAEDLPDASFAGQQDTYLNIRGPEALIDACKRCFASLFTDRAISYRHDKGFGQFDVYLSIVVQKMVRSDSACSGVMFSIDTESGLQGCGLSDRRLGAGRKRGPGRGQPGRVLRLQADPQRGQAADCRQAGRQPKRSRWSTTTSPAPRSRSRISTPPRKSAAPTSSATTRSCSWPAGPASSRTITARAMDIEWAKDGDGVKRRHRQALHRPGPAGNRAFPDQQKGHGNLCAQGEGHGAGRGSGGRRQDRPGRGQRHLRRQSISTISRRARSWSPT